VSDSEKTKKKVEKKSWFFIMFVVKYFYYERFRPSQDINRWRNQGLL
jgi:hypothetical protein